MFVEGGWGGVPQLVGGERSVTVKGEVIGGKGMPGSVGMPGGYACV